MTPLDLTQAPPRPCRAELDGITYLPRAIDKTRASLPGGKLGEYVILMDDIATVSALFYRKMKMSHDEFAAAVAGAGSEDEVAAWLRQRVDQTQIDRWHAQIFAIKVGDIPNPEQERVFERHPGARTMPGETLLIDVLDNDDAEMFAGA
jgi:hypothetical protein